MNEIEFPPIIEFQTSSLCNAKCKICPYEVKQKKYAIQTMDDLMFEKIMCELDDNKPYIKRVIPYMNNEPTLDIRLIDILRRLKLSNFFVELSTNFSGMTERLMASIVDEKLVDDLRISFFGGDELTYKELMPGLNFAKTYELINKFVKINNNIIHTEIYTVMCPWIEKDNILNIQKLFPELQVHKLGYLDRAGNVECQKNALLDSDSRFIFGCELYRPFERMCILANGDAIICSQDWDREVILGNVFLTSIKDVWNGEIAREVRNTFREGKVINGDFICKRCKLAIIKREGDFYKNFLGDRYMSKDGKKMI